MEYEQLIVDLDGPVAIVRLNNPGTLNALSRIMTRELLEALQGLEENGSVRAIMITGEGRGFCAGADLSELEDVYRSGGGFQPSTLLRHGYNRLVSLIAEGPKPVVAGINGVAAGAGVSLALACDYRMADDRASLNLAFVRIGLIPDAGSCYFLPRAVGHAKALELTMLSDRIDASTALDIGLVNRVVPAGALVREATELARRLADLPTRAIGLTKQALSRAPRLSLEEALELEAGLQDEAASTADHVEGVLAFLDKRPPSFTGN